MYGFEHETYTAATKAIRCGGLIVGQWCKKALRAATESPKDKPAVVLLKNQLLKIVELVAEQNRQAAAREEGQEKEARELKERLTAIEAVQRPTPKKRLHNTPANAL
ncbi:hypothetical protein [Jiella marina]|uniref:hypothetical protein n=1 Tax=Jiella sp. LLJ827 TaxID=2917712 RepID=UPI002101466B|nr:hypothetical protein [Jiella sp. LLJ827]MCQ0990605.1 hypothetical protein [Jiella sp. LLJ827]